MRKRDLKRGEPRQRSFKQWLKDNFDAEQLERMAKGEFHWFRFYGMAYPADLQALYSKYHKKMWEEVLAQSNIREGMTPLHVLDEVAAGWGRTIRNHNEFVMTVVWLYARTVAGEILMDLGERSPPLPEWMTL